MIKRALALLLIIIIVFLNTTMLFAAQPSVGAANNNVLPPIKLESNSSILIEATRGQVIYEKNASKKVHISAASKIMTTIVALENSNLYNKITISKDSVEGQISSLGLVIGEKYDLEDLLYAMVLTSANDAASAIAENIGGDTEKFVAMMNDTVIKLNLKDTHFTNPTGLFDENQYTTPHDIAALTKYAITNPTFNRIFSTRVKPWTGNDGKIKVLTSQNKLFLSYDSVDGGKTGYNEKDKQSIITTASKNNMRLICVVLDVPEKAMYSDASKLLDYGFNYYRNSLLVSSDDTQTNIQIIDEEIPLITKTDIFYIHPIGDSYIEDIKFDIKKNLAPPIDKNTIVGQAKFMLKDKTVISVNLYSSKDVTVKQDLMSYIKNSMLSNKDILVLLIILIAIEVILVLYNLVKLIIRGVRRLVNRV